MQDFPGEVDEKRLKIGALAGRIRQRRFRVEPYDPDAKDADGDGTVQDGTPWERPAGAKLVDADGNEVPKGATTTTGLGSLRVVDGDGRQVGSDPGGRRPSRLPLRRRPRPVGDPGPAPVWGDLAERVGEQKQLVNGLLDEHFYSEEAGIDPANRIVNLSEVPGPNERYRITDDGRALTQAVTDVGNTILDGIGGTRYGAELDDLNRRIRRLRDVELKDTIARFDKERRALRRKQREIERRRLDELSMRIAGVDHEELKQRSREARKSTGRSNKWSRAFAKVAGELENDPERLAAVRAIDDLGEREEVALRSLNELQERRELLHREALVEGLRAAGVEFADGTEIGFAGKGASRDEQTAAMRGALRFFPKRWVELVGDVNDGRIPVREGKRGGVLKKFLQAHEVEEVELSRRVSWDPEANDFLAVAAHETTHLMEIPEVRMLEHLFYLSRTEGEDPKPYGGWNSDGDVEMVRPDDFFHQYAGRTYGGTPDHTYEVLSSLMGRAFGLDRSFDRFPDREHLAWALGVLASVEPRFEADRLKGMLRRADDPSIVAAPDADGPDDEGLPGDLDEFDDLDDFDGFDDDDETPSPEEALATVVGMFDDVDAAAQAMAEAKAILKEARPLRGEERMAAMGRMTRAMDRSRDILRRLNLSKGERVRFEKDPIFGTRAVRTDDEYDEEGFDRYELEDSGWDMAIALDVIGMQIMEDARSEEITVLEGPLREAKDRERVLDGELKALQSSYQQAFDEQLRELAMREYGVGIRDLSDAERATLTKRLNASAKEIRLMRGIGLDLDPEADALYDIKQAIEEKTKEFASAEERAGRLQGEITELWGREVRDALERAGVVFANGDEITFEFQKRKDSVLGDNAEEEIALAKEALAAALRAYPKAWVDEVARLRGNRPVPLDVTKRGHVTGIALIPSTAMMALSRDTHGGDPYFDTAVHEVAHLMESLPGVAAAEHVMLWSRVFPGSAPRLWDPEAKGEMAWTGEFPHPYIGRIYGDTGPEGSFEVVSMAMQGLFGSKEQVQAGFDWAVQIDENSSLDTMIRDTIGLLASYNPSRGSDGTLLEADDVPSPRSARMTQAAVLGGEATADGPDRSVGEWRREVDRLGAAARERLAPLGEGLEVMRRLRVALNADDGTANVAEGWRRIRAIEAAENLSEPSVVVYVDGVARQVDGNGNPVDGGDPVPAGAMRSRRRVWELTDEGVALLESVEAVGEQAMRRLLEDVDLLVAERRAATADAKLETFKRQATAAIDRREREFLAILDLISLRTRNQPFANLSAAEKLAVKRAVMANRSPDAAPDGIEPDERERAREVAMAMLDVSDRLQQFENEYNDAFSALRNRRYEALKQLVRDAGIEFANGDEVPIAFRGGSAVEPERQQRATEAVRLAIQEFPKPWAEAIAAAGTEIIVDVTDGRGEMLMDPATGNPMVLLSSAPVPGGRQNEHFSVAVHELTHIMEMFVPSVTHAEHAFFWDTADTSIEPTVEDGGNQTLDVRWSGAFNDSYAGTWNGGRSGSMFEVLSTTMEDHFGRAAHQDNNAVFESGKDFQLRFALGLLLTLGGGQEGART